MIRSHHAIVRSHQCDRSFASMRSFDRIHAIIRSQPAIIRSHPTIIRSHPCDHLLAFYDDIVAYYEHLFIDCSYSPEYCPLVLAHIILNPVSFAQMSAPPPPDQQEDAMNLDDPPADLPHVPGSSSMFTSSFAIEFLIKYHSFSNYCLCSSRRRGALARI